MRCSIITTGAGGTAIGALMGVAGCSRTLIDAQVPYSTSVSRMILDNYPKALVSEKVGVELAQAAFHRCQRIVEEEGSSDADIIGLGATAAIATDRNRKGADVAYISCWARTGVTSYRLLLSKAQDRVAQEQLVSNVILLALADGARVPLDESTAIMLPQWCAAERLHIAATAAEAACTEIDGSCMSKSFKPISGEPFESLLNGTVEKVLVNRNGCPKLNLPPYQEDNIDPDAAHYLLYPGSFNPLHWGHTELARVASTVVQSRDEASRRKPVIVTYEVAISRVGKKDLTSEDLDDQAAQFADGNHRVAFTTAKLFVDKARMFPHHGLVVGIDTVVRVLDPLYYGNNRETMLNAMRQIRAHNCYFVVGGRLRDGVWVDLSSVSVPSELDGMFIPIPQRLFRVDISSTEIRERRSSISPQALD